jgi:hypothetical protein
VFFDRYDWRHLFLKVFVKTFQRESNGREFKRGLKKLTVIIFVQLLVDLPTRNDVVKAAFPLPN